jgi:hypothetical protein
MMEELLSGGGATGMVVVAVVLVIRELRTWRNGKSNGTAEVFTRIEKLIGDAAQKSGEAHAKTTAVLHAIELNIAKQTERLAALSKGQEECRRQTGELLREVRRGA